MQSVATIKRFAIVKQLTRHYLPQDNQEAYNLNSIIPYSAVLSFWEKIMMGLTGDSYNVTGTPFHPGQLYWIILLQSSTKFLIHSVKISSHDFLSGRHSRILSISKASDDLLSQFDIPVDDLSELCIEDVYQEYNSKMFFCPNSTPNFLHQIVIFHTNDLQTNVSRVDTKSNR